MQSSRECVFFRFGLARDFPVGEPGAVVGGPRPARGGRSSPSVVGSGASEGWPLRQVPTPTASRPPPRVRRVCPPSGVPPRRVPRELLRSVAAVGRSPGTPPASVRGPILELAGCDRLTISPKLLDALAESTDPIERRLSQLSADECGIDDWKPTEKEFRWALNEDACATEKLAEGIRGFTKDLIKLDKKLSGML